MDIKFLYANRIGVMPVMNIQWIYFQYSLLEQWILESGFRMRKLHALFLFWPVLSQAEVAPFDDLLCIDSRHGIPETHIPFPATSSNRKGRCAQCAGCTMENDGKCIVFDNTLVGKEHMLNQYLFKCFVWMSIWIWIAKKMMIFEYILSMMFGLKPMLHFLMSKSMRQLPTTRVNLSKNGGQDSSTMPGAMKLAPFVSFQVGKKPFPQHGNANRTCR